MANYLRVTWSRSAAVRALRAMIIAPGLFALCFELIGNAQMTTFAVFGSFGALLMASFGGSRRDKAIAHLGLTVAGSITLTIGTLVSGSVWLATLVTIPVAFAVFFAGVAGPNAANGVTAVLLVYVLPVASASPASVIPWRLAGWLLASAVSAAAVLLFSPRSAGDQLRGATAATAAALAHHLEAAVAGKATQADLDAVLAAKHKLMIMFSDTPYRPIGLATADQRLADVIHMVEWCTALTCDAMGGHLDLSMASPQDRQVLTQAAVALRAVAAMLTGQDAGIDLEPIWRARAASAAHMEALTGEEATLRTQVGYAFHAQSIGLAASAAAADAVIACGQATRESVASERQRWVDGLTEGQPGRRLVIEGQRQPGGLVARVGDLVAATATSRSVWFRNSARGAIALAGAVAIARVTNVQHGFWVVLGTLSVLRTSASSTGSTALRAVAGTLAGFLIGGALLIGIGTSQPALWAALPIAVFVAAYTPGTAPFAFGQAAFTITIVVLFNLLHPAGWRVGLVRIEDVALGCAVSAIVGILFWPRGASSVVGDNLAEALRSGAEYLTESITCALSLGLRHPVHAMTAISAGTRLDDAVRSYLTEQGSKRIDKRDLWVLLMAAQRIRLTAHSLSSLPGRGKGSFQATGTQPTPPQRPASTRSLVGSQYIDLAAFYDRIAEQVGPPARGKATLAEVPIPDSLTQPQVTPDGNGSGGPDALWVRLHIEQLCSHAASLPGPAAKLAVLRRTAWWRAPSAQGQPG
ncbi:MAG TPA: FUSC family protein [Streptosporangiaceae bacterium]|nr:FUSC family protein [Streptosporangiaceae bacterium]